MQVLLSLLFATSVLATTLQTLSFDFVKESKSSNQLQRRAGGIVQVDDSNYPADGLLYLVDLAIGTPPVTQRCQVDTGSSTLIVETSDSDICSIDPPNPCTKFGAYNANASSTYQYLDSDMSVQFGGGDGTTGDHALDHVGIGGVTLVDYPFGIMYNSTVAEAVLGIGFTEAEKEGKTGYTDNLPVLLTKQGYIPSRTYSLWTNDLHSATGKLLFGGYDSAKYYGQLTTIPMAPDEENGPIISTAILLLGASGNDGCSSTGTAFTGYTPEVYSLDSGTTYSVIDPGLAQQIWDYAGAITYFEGFYQAYIPCSQKYNQSTIDFQFAGKTIKVPFSQLVLQPVGGPYCFFGIEKGSTLIGDTIMSSMYIVYDLDNKQISIGQTVFNTTQSNVIPIPAGASQPNAPGVSSPPSTNVCSSTSSTSSQISTTSTSIQTTSNTITTKTTSSSTALSSSLTSSITTSSASSTKTTSSSTSSSATSTTKTSSASSSSSTSTIATPSPSSTSRSMTSSTTGTSSTKPTTTTTPSSTTRSSSTSSSSAAFPSCPTDAATCHQPFYLKCKNINGFSGYVQSQNDGQVLCGADNGISGCGSDTKPFFQLLKNGALLDSRGRIGFVDPQAGQFEFTYPTSSAITQFYIANCGKSPAIGYQGSTTFYACGQKSAKIYPGTQTPNRDPAANGCVAFTFVIEYIV